MIKPVKEDFYNKLDELIKLNLQKKAYDINLIDELHVNENAHTRILMKLLEFTRDNNYYILQKFLELLNERLEDTYKIENFVSPKFKYQWADIDGYIYQDKKNAIIIENKIFTSDHDQQLQAYSNWINNQDVDEKFLIYLTLYGSKSTEG